MKKGRGNLIIVEGPDGAGKSTIIEILINHLKNLGINSQLFTFPGKIQGTLGELIYRVHHNSKKDFGVLSMTPLSLQALHIAAHLDALESSIIPALRSGYTVVIDRFWWSTWVYGRMAGVHSASLDKLIDAEIEAWGEFQPDYAILIDRDSALREDGIKDWDILRKLYHDLILEKKGSYPIHVVRNDSNPNNALESICEILEIKTPSQAL